MIYHHIQCLVLAALFLYEGHLSLKDAMTLSAYGRK